MRARSASSSTGWFVAPGNVIDRELRRTADVDAIAIVASASIVDLARSGRSASDVAHRGFPSKRAELRPDVVEEQRLRRGRRVDAVGLEHFVALAEALEEERHERRLVRFRDVGKKAVEFANVRRAVVRRQLSCRR